MQQRRRRGMAYSRLLDLLSGCARHHPTTRNFLVVGWWSAHPDNRFVDEFCHWWAFFLAISATTFHLCKKFTICQSHKLPHIFTIYIFRNTPYRGNLPNGALVCWDLPTNEWLRLQTRLFSYDPETPPRAKHRYHNFFKKKIVAWKDILFSCMLWKYV